MLVGFSGIGLINPLDAIWRIIIIAKAHGPGCIKKKQRYSDEELNRVSVTHVVIFLSLRDLLGAQQAVNHLYRQIGNVTQAQSCLGVGSSPPLPDKDIGIEKTGLWERGQESRL
jgi:hypothetical protein